MSGNFDAALARETASAEVHALTAALLEAFDATLRDPDLSQEELNAGLKDVLQMFQSEGERRIDGWIGADSGERIG